MRNVVRCVALALVASLVVACGGAGEAETPASRPSDVRPPSDAQGYPEDEARWQKFHSKRFGITLPFPDGRSWRIDDHSRDELVAAQASTSSTAVLEVWSEPELMNRAKCEERARARGLVPEGRFATVADEVTVSPEAYDTRVWVALKTGGNESSPLEGHLLAFGAYIRKCLFFRLTSAVPSGRDESVLSARLASARVRMFGKIALDDFDAVPRQK